MLDMLPKGYGELPFLGEESGIMQLCLITEVLRPLPCVLHETDATSHPQGIALSPHNTTQAEQHQ